MAERTERVIVGIDTHKTFHTIAVIGETGQEIEVRDFPADNAGYKNALAWAGSFGEVLRAGIEGVGCYGAGVFIFFRECGIEVYDVYKSDKQQRRRRGKNNELDAFEAAAAALSLKRCVTAKEKGELLQSLQLLKTTYEQAVKQRTASINALKADIVKLPDEMRRSLEGLSSDELVKTCSSFRVSKDALSLEAGAKKALRSLAKRIQGLKQEAKELDLEIKRYARMLAPNTMALPGVAHHGATTFLCAAGQNIGRFKNESSFSMLCGTSPIPASTGDKHHFRLNRGGDRKANCALHTMALTRMKNCEKTQAYISKKMSENKTKKDAVRCLKRYLSREVFWSLKADIAALALSA